jgi:uncharacterized membrane protein
MRVSWQTEWPMWLLLGAQFLLAAGSWSGVPDRVPGHWALDGQTDGNGSRFQGLLLLPLVSLGVYLAMLFAPQVDLRRGAYPRFAGSYTILRFAVLALMTAIYGMIQLALRGYELPVIRVVPLSLGALFVVIGYQLGRLRLSAPAAARIPWPLADQENWVRTNRLAGRLLIGAGGTLLLAGALGSPLLMVVAVAGTVLGSIGLIAYAYRAWAPGPPGDSADPA